MKQSHINDNTKKPKKSLHYKQYFQKDIFDEEFLNEKDKALSPIILSDKIPGETKRKSKKKKNKKKLNLKQNEEKDIKYGSNVVYIESKIDDNDKDEFRDIMNEQVLKIIVVQQFKKSPNKRIKNKI